MDLEGSEVAADLRCTGAIPAVPDDELPQEHAQGDPLSGFILADKYEFLEQIGDGGSGLVYKARHIQLDKLVAIKIMFPHLTLNEVKVQRFKQEAQTISQLKHPNIVNVLDFGQGNRGEPYLVMEYLQGVTLADIIEGTGALPLERALPIFIQICEALIYAHNKGLIHRDLKPSNIMLVSEPQEAECVKLIDFGLVKQLIEKDDLIRLTQTGEVFGSPYYMSPEQVRAERVDARTDVYAMGIIIYETLMGMPPFLGDDPHSVFRKQLTHDPGRITGVYSSPGMRDQLELIVLQAMAKEPERRYQNMAALKSDLTNLTAPRESMARASTLWNLVAMRCNNFWNNSSKSMLVLLLAVAILIGIVTSLFYTFVIAQGTSLNPDKYITWEVEKKVVQMDPTEMRDQDLMIQVLINNFYKEKNRDLGRYADALNRQAKLFLETGRYAKAESAFKELIPVRQQLDGRRSISVIDAVNSLAACYYNQGRYDDAGSLYRDNLAAAQSIFGRNNLELALPLSNQADIYSRQKKYKEAQPLFLRALDIWKEQALENSSDSLLTQSHLADNYYYQGQLTKAGNLYRSLLPKWRKFDGQLFQNAAVCLQRLAEIAERQNDLRSAIDYYKQELEVIARIPNADNLKIAAIEKKLSQLLWQQGQWIESMQFNSHANTLLAKAPLR